MADANSTTLLLIEDHRDIAEMVAEYFEQRGCSDMQSGLLALGAIAALSLATAL